MVDWEMHGMEFGNCNCAYGCPCQFNALPTYGNCRAIGFFAIDKGYFGEAKLDGLKMGFAVKWPGPVHGGGGEMQPFVDVKGNEKQRQAMLSIMTGKETEPMATFFAVYTAMCAKVNEPVVTSIDISMDMKGRTAKCEAKGVASGRGEPIRNPVTGAEHHVGIVLPNGFEYTQNECGRGWSKSTGAVAFELNDSYAHWCEIHLNRRGVIRQ